jgi:PAS domain S-box-containing protein
MSKAAMKSHLVSHGLSESKKSEEKYRGLLEAAPDAMVVVNQGGEIVLLNVQAEKQFGYRRDELLGQKVKNIIPEGFAERLIADDLRSAEDALAQQIGTGIELIGRRKDGSEFPIELMLSPLESAEGILVTAAIRNISMRKAAEKHLAQMEGRYRGLLEAAPDAMVVVNQGGEIVLLNVQAEKQFGYRRDELLGQKVKNIIPVGFAERLIADDLRSAEDALAQQIGTGIELIGRRKDGGEFPIEIMLSPLKSAEGILVTAAIRNISVRKAAEAHLAQMEGRRRLVEDALRESQEQYRMLLDGVEDHAIFMMDPQGQIVSWNAGAERTKGYTADEIIGHNFSNFFPPEDIERGRPEEVLRITAASGRHEEQGMRVRKDGSRFLASVTFTALRDPAGNLRGFSEFSHDLSKSKEAEAKYRGLLEAAPDAMVVVNQGGEIVLLNVQAEKQFGYRRDELLGQKVKNIIPEGFAERLIADDLRSAEDALAQQIGTGIELIGRRKDGSEFPIEIMLSPLENAQGTLVTAAIRDITTRKMAEANLLLKVKELNRSNEELGQFAYIASHDLQEPLRMVASYTQLLSRRYKGKLDADADEFIAFAVDGASRMQRLIQDLLAYSRVGTKGSDLLDISSEDALQQALINLHGAIEESGALVTHDPLPTVFADETQLTQLFQNLVGNAIKYQRPGVPRVHISAAVNGGKKWTFSVRDNGLGIDPQYFEKIFGMFQRLHKREAFAGTGIGLAICKKIVEQHGGSITVESQPEQGSTFRFVLARSEKTP